MTGNNDRFTGGDTLTAGTLEHATHLAMMSNELNGGRGAYRISNAELGASGPSFGPFQYDLGANRRARDLFEEIATTAVDANGRRLISDRDLELIRNNLYQPFSAIEADPAAQRVYDRLQPAMNAVLSSDTGRRLINDDYLVGIDAKVQSVNATIAAVPDETNRAFLHNNRLAQLIVLDTANQYGSTVNNGLRQFMGMNAESDPLQMPGRNRAEKIAVNGEFGLEDMIRYKLETQYGQNDRGARDVLRRVSNLIDAAGPANVGLSAEDREFLNTGLAQYLRDNGRNVDLTDPALAGLRRLAEQPAQTTGLDPAQPTAQSNTQAAVQIDPIHRRDFDSIFAAVDRDGRWNPDQSNNIAGGLLRNFVVDPALQRLDSVVVGNTTRDGATNVFAVYQPQGQAGPTFRTSVDANEFASVPLRDSMRQMNAELGRTQQQEQQQAQAQVANPHVRRGP